MSKFNEIVRLEQSKVEAEHLYHWLMAFFKSSPKISWEKNELLAAIKDQYIELLKMNQEDSSLRDDAISRMKEITDVGESVERRLLK